MRVVKHPTFQKTSSHQEDVNGCVVVDYKSVSIDCERLPKGIFVLNLRIRTKELNLHEQLIQLEAACRASRRSDCIPKHRDVRRRYRVGVRLDRDRSIEESMCDGTHLPLTILREKSRLCTASELFSVLNSHSAYICGEDKEMGSETAG